MREQAIWSSEDESILSENPLQTRESDNDSRSAIRPAQVCQWRGLLRPEGLHVRGLGSESSPQAKRVRGQQLRLGTSPISCAMVPKAISSSCKRRRGRFGTCRRPLSIMCAMSLGLGHWPRRRGSIAQGQLRLRALSLSALTNAKMPNQPDQKAWLQRSCSLACRRRALRIPAGLGGLRSVEPPS